jgi:hypothetical protein
MKFTEHTQFEIHADDVIEVMFSSKIFFDFYLQRNIK